MSNDNRVSATLSAQDVDDIQNALALMRSKLPFLLTLSPQERRELPRLGDKSVGFEDKCATYMSSHPEYLPGFVKFEEVEKDRLLRQQIMRFSADLMTLSEQVDDTLAVVSSELWLADLAYYHAVREAGRRHLPGAKAIYDDLSQRFPRTGKTSPTRATTPEAPATA